MKLDPQSHPTPKKTRSSIGLCVGFLLLCCLQMPLLWGQNLTYHLSMPKPHTHYFEVEMAIADWKQEQLLIKMPTWAPGSYLIREFSRHVEGEMAQDAEGKALPFEKTTKNTWRIDTKSIKKGSTVRFSYRVYAYEHSVRTSFLDASHGYLNGSSVFMWVEGLQNQPTTLKVTPYAEWKNISTSLPTVGDDKWTRTAENYDLLVDSPMEIGNHHSFFFIAAGIEHEVAMYGERFYDEPLLSKAMQRMVETTAAIFEAPHPCKNYVFIVHNVSENNGGLEHLNSTSLIVNRFAYTTQKGLLDFLSLVAHEYFHLWNVKRLRPIELGPFNYDAENYTRQLWISEGFTSYYDELLLYRAGFISQEDYFKKLEWAINTLENRKGREVQAVSESSFDTWIKFYRPHENSSNNSISYYNAGTVYAALLDITITESTKGKANLDDLMRYLYAEYYQKKARGFTEAEFKAAAEKIAGTKLDDFFEKYIYGVEVPNYAEFFAKVGVTLQVEETTTLDLGARVGEEGGSLVAKGIDKGSLAEQMGLNVNDEILALNGFRTKNINDFKNIWNLFELGIEGELLVSRDKVLVSLPFVMKAQKSLNRKLVLSTSEKELEKTQAARQKWLTKAQ
ncbi:M61 family metallopeptidase [Hugenholtzia roseola]|uniref:M61 family metallopeptidase n=1 Tax=Hugenholtzia roseola TaxID=1002 RepID=UPI0003FCB772|nr:M61 family metallopeptidase [Hugenholtzia roseola]